MASKILIPLDGSESSMRALDHAIGKLKAQPGATALLLTVHPPLHIYGEMRMYIGDDKVAQMAAQHDREILEPAENKLRQHGVSFNSETAEGDAGTMIAERAVKNGCTEIVMGSRGLGRVAGLVLGSAATKVVHLTNVPVTLVK